MVEAVGIEKPEVYSPCFFCGLDVGNQSNYKWSRGKAINEFGEEVLYCQYLIHPGNFLTLKDNEIKDVKEPSPIVHTECCKSKCYRGGSCSHRLW